MNYRPSELANLVLYLALAPVIVIALRRTLPKVPSACYVALGAVLGAYVFTVAEGFFLPVALNIAEHLCYAVTGVAFVVALFQFRRIVPPAESSR